MSDTMTDHADVEVRGPVVSREDDILTDAALAFVAELQRRFGHRRDELLIRRGRGSTRCRTATGLATSFGARSARGDGAGRRREAASDPEHHADGYGQYAYQFGGGRITGEPDAPDKYIAANELQRVYDLEHDRFQLLERRNMLFPFLGPFGHSWAPVNQVLDGDIAYDVQGGKTRARRARERQPAAGGRRPRPPHADDDQPGRAGARADGSGHAALGAAPRGHGRASST